MAQRLVFTSPVSLVFRGLEIDRIDEIDLISGRISGFYSLLRTDGLGWRSLPFVMTMAGAVTQFEAAILNRLKNQTDRIDGQDAPLTGTLVDVPRGSVIP